MFLHKPPEYSPPSPETLRMWARQEEQGFAKEMIIAMASREGSGLDVDAAFEKINRSFALLKGM